MFYFRSEKFYSDLNLFISHDFENIRNLYLYNNCILIDKIEEEMSNFFCSEFMIFLKRVKIQYPCDKFLPSLKTLVKALKAKHDNYIKVISKKELDNEEKEYITHKLLEFFKQDIKIKYKVDVSIVAGLIIVNDYKIYDLSIKTVLEKINNQVIQKIIKNGAKSFS